MNTLLILLTFQIFCIETLAAWALASLIKK